MVNSIVFKGLLVIVFLFFVSCESALMREFNHHMAGNDTERAKEILERELTVNPGSVDANYLMGSLLIREKKYEEANSYFDRSLNSSLLYSEHINYIRERNYRNHFNAGMDAWQQGDTYETIRQLNFAIEVFPNRVEPYPVLGKAYEYTDQLDVAQETYKKCLSIVDSHMQCSNNLVHVNFEIQEYDKVLELTDKYLIIYPESDFLLKKKAYALFEINELDKSESVFREYLSVNYQYSALKQYAIELFNVGEIYRAEKYFSECLEIRPFDTDVLSALGSIYLETGEYRLMVETNERLLSFDTSSKIVQKNLMLAYELVGDIDSYKKMKKQLGLE